MSAPACNRRRQEFGGAKDAAIKRLKAPEKEITLKIKVGGRVVSGQNDAQWAGGEEVASRARKSETVTPWKTVLQVAGSVGLSKVIAKTRNTHHYPGIKRDKDRAGHGIAGHFGSYMPRADCRMPRTLLRQAGIMITPSG